MKDDIVIEPSDSERNDLPIATLQYLVVLESMVDRHEDTIERQRELLREARRVVALMSHRVFEEVDVPHANNLLTRIGKELGQ